MAETSPHIWPRKRVLPQRTGMEYKQNVITPTLTRLSTLQKLKDPSIGTFVNEPGGDSPKQLNLTAKITQFQPHFLHLMQSQIFTFAAELGSRTCLQSSTICHSFSFSRFEEINKFQIFHSSQIPQD